MDLLLIALCITVVVTSYFRHNPMDHGSRFLVRRFVNWFPMGMTYAFLYMARYNLVVAQGALKDQISLVDFGWIFGAGTIVYGLSFLINGPLTDKFGGKKGIIISAVGASVANIAMGVVLYLSLHGRLPFSLLSAFAILYPINMYFQSFGGGSIIKVKAYWFHVRERGIFGAIFGTLISFGVYFAYDWGQAIVKASKAHVEGEPTLLQVIFQKLFSVSEMPVDSIWLVFFIPAAILLGWALLDLWLIKDTPGEAGHEDFDTHDASSGEMDKEFSFFDLLHRILTNPLMLTFAAIEFCGGVIRNGIMQWYLTFAKSHSPGVVGQFFIGNWGLLLCFAGILGGFAGGIVSDKYFQSRRAPPVAMAQGTIFVVALVMALFLFSSPLVVGLCALTMSCAVIAVHSLMSGTAAADFGGRKATATAQGIVDGCVYLGSGLQSICLGYINNWNWQLWPVFMAPFGLIGCLLAIRIWKEIPAATLRYLVHIEKVVITSEQSEISVSTTSEELEIIQPN